LGCDVFYSGCLNKPILQKKVVDFVGSFYDGNYYFLHPEAEILYDIKYLGEKSSKRYPFNYFGVIPKLNDDRLLNRGQFVFDYNNGGKLVTLHKLPSSYALVMHNEYSDAKIDIIAENGGYLRAIESASLFIFLLIIIKIKWWPDLRIADDYCIAEEILEKISDSGIGVMLKKKCLDFDTARSFYLQETLRKNIKQKNGNNNQPFRFPGNNQKNEKCNSKPALSLVQRNPEEVHVQDMDLSIRSTMCLQRSGVENLAQLLSYSNNDLTAIKNLGRRCVEEIMQKLRSYGYEIHVDD
jgi:hypothetical protein